MKGLLYKDISSSSGFFVMSSFISLFLTMILIIGYSASEEPVNGFFLSIYFVALAILLAVNTFQRDEVSKWNTYALTLPIDRKLLVQSKYILLGLFLAFYYLLSVLLSVVLRYFTLPFLWGHLVTLTITLVLLSAFIPFVYQWGIVRAFAPPLLLYLFFHFVLRNHIKFLTQIENNHHSLVYIAVCLVSVLVYCFSCYLSCRILEKKDIVFAETPYSPKRKKVSVFSSPKESKIKSNKSTVASLTKLLWYKEFLFLRSTMISILLSSAIFTVLVANDIRESGLTLGMSPLNLWIFALTIMLPYHSFRNDETKNWNVFLHSLPIQKNQLVKSKYLFFSAFLLLSIFCSFLIFLILFPITQKALWFYSTILALGLLFHSIYLPLAYTRGAQQSFFLVGVAYITFYLTSVILLGYSGSSQLPSIVSTLPCGALFLAVSTAFYLASYPLSCKMMERSEVH